MKKLISSALALALCTAIFAGCSTEDTTDTSDTSSSTGTSTEGSSTESSTSETDENIVMTIHGIDFTANEYAYILQSLGLTANDMTTDFDYMAEYAAYILTQKASYAKVISDAGESINDEDVAYVDEMIAMYESVYGEEGFAEYLAYIGTSKDLFIDDALLYTAYERVATYVHGYGSLTDEELYEKYENDFIKSQHILITLSSTSDGLTEDEVIEYNAAAYDTAADILARALAGEDFDALSLEYNADTAQPSTGYAFVSGYMVEEFEAASLEVEPGEIYPELVETSYGYHIIKGIAASQENFEENYTTIQAGNGEIIAYNEVVTNMNTTPTYTDLFYEIDASNFMDYITDSNL